MRRVLVLGVVMGTTAIASADPPNDAAAVARAAHAAGLRGDCIGARVLAGRVRTMDPDLHRSVAIDPAITGCRPSSRSEQIRALERESSDPSTNTGGLFAAQVVIGWLSGAGAYFVGGYAGASIAGDRLGGGGETPPSPKWLGVPRGFLIGSVVSATLVIPTTVTLLGNSRRGRGSYLASLGGTAVGMAVAVTAMSKSRETGVLLLAIAPVTGALIGYHATFEERPTPIAMPMLRPVMNEHGASLVVAGTF